MKDVEKHTTHSNTWILTIKQIHYIIKYMKHLNITENIERFVSFSNEIVILLYIDWYLSLSKNALYIHLYKRKCVYITTAVGKTLFLDFSTKDIIITCEVHLQCCIYYISNINYNVSVLCQYSDVYLSQYPTNDPNI